MVFLFQQAIYNLIKHVFSIGGKVNREHLRQRGSTLEPMVGRKVAPRCNESSHYDCFRKADLFLIKPAFLKDFCKSKNVPHTIGYQFRTQGAILPSLYTFSTVG